MAFPEDHVQHSISHDGEEEGDRFVWRPPIYQPPTRQPLLPPNHAKNQKKALGTQACRARIVGFSNICRFSCHAPFATSPSLPTSITARPPSSTSFCASPVPSATISRSP